MRLRFLHPELEALLGRPPVEALPPKPRQPVHTVFGGAHLFRAGVVDRFQALALESLATFAPDADALGAVFGLESGALANAVFARVREKLLREPIEDYRIDFEDGYGVRAGTEEDGHAVSAATEVVAGMAAESLPWRVGVRVKSLDPAERERSVRTLRLFLSTMIGEAGRLPPNFIVNLPKVTSAEEVAEFAGILAALEREFGLAEGVLRFEVMIETPQIVLGADGRSPLSSLAGAAGERLAGAIFGAYDFTAALGITAANQSLRYPSCDFARNMMLVAFAGSNMQLSDGATAVLPVPLHAAKAGIVLTPAQHEENRRSVHGAWKVHYGNIRHAMANGFYQGWDLHPAQLVSRYAATFAFFLEGRDAAATRLKNFIAKSAQATRVGSAFDDAATGHGLVNFFRRAVNCGAMTMGEVAAMIGADVSAQFPGF
jgi:citrate lyase beta subunit